MRANRLMSIGLSGIGILSVLLQPGCVNAMEREHITYRTVQMEAKELASKPYREGTAKLPEQLRRMSYDQYRDIRFRPEEALWLADNLPFHIQLFHRGYLFQNPVFIYEYTETHSQELPYVVDFFRFGNLEIDQYPRRNAGYAGWRLHAPLNTSNYFDEVIAFLGASYFRSLGKGQFYGISARGLLLPHVPGETEEFPAFTTFWLRKPEKDSKTMIALALLDSPSLSGAYEFRITPGDPTRIDVLLTLYPRVEVDEIGLGSLTSMFYFGENSYPKPNDFRPEVHDSDGLGMQYLDRKFLWRPLDKRDSERSSRFDASDIRAFGLYQRDRDPDSYLDGESRYHRRPSVEIRPGNGFSGGEVLLRELPPEKEFGDNIIVAYVPDLSLLPGNVYRFDYTMYWGDFQLPEGKGSILQTRHGKDVNNPDKQVFLVEFRFPDQVETDSLKPVVEVSANAILDRVLVLPGETRNTARVHLHLDPQSGGDVELSLSLTRNKVTVTEEWIYLWSR